MKSFNKPMIASASAALLLGLSSQATVAENPFVAESMSSGYTQLAHDHNKDKEGKCGEGKCGEDKAKKKAEREGKCGEGKCGEEKAEREGKCGEGKCGEDKKDRMEKKDKDAEGESGAY